MTSKSTKRISVGEAAKLRGCSIAAVKALLRAGKFPGARKERGTWAIPMDELAVFYRSVDSRRKLRRFPEPRSDQKLAEEQLRPA